MYDELWTGGKCMYKLEPMLADGGELIIYAPHLQRLGTHGHIRKDRLSLPRLFLVAVGQVQTSPLGHVAHSTHVRGIGKFENGVEHCRAKVTLATRIPRETCEKINLGYRDPDSIELEEFANREDEGVLLVQKPARCSINSANLLRGRVSEPETVGPHCVPDFKRRNI